MKIRGIIGMGEPKKELTLEEKLAGLNPGDLVYLHPAVEGSYPAYFAEIASNANGELTLKEYGSVFEFRTNPMTKTSIWTLAGDDLTLRPHTNKFPISNLTGSMKLYVGYVNIMRGMRENNNHNVDHVIYIMQKLGHGTQP